MFYPLIPGFVAILMGVSVVNPPQAIPLGLEISKPAAHQPALSVPAVPAPLTAERAAPVMVEVITPAVPQVAPVAATVNRETVPVEVIEAPARLTFERIRRENFRYPETGTVGRFIELSTECPPLFE